MGKTVSRFYKFFRPLVMLLPPEVAHTISHLVFKALYSVPKIQIKDPLLKTTALGMEFSNPIGIAAGFDKDAKIARALFRAGFGFVEVGTLTPKPQLGNPKPRLFRLSEDDALINRLGFNNEGFQAALKRLTNFPQKNRKGVLGINIGANKTSSEPIKDYITGLETFFTIADYFTINVSSPNTPGLRDLQEEKHLKLLLKEISAKRRELAKKAGEDGPPLLIKIAPDLESGQLEMIVTLALKEKIDGLIISNTTIARPKTLKSKMRDEVGGLSGQPLFENATAVLAQAYSLSKGKLTLIGVGGVANAGQAFEKILAGASLVQVYTGLIFEGPGLANILKKDLAELLRSQGYSSVSQAVGKSVKKTKK